MKIGTSMWGFRELELGAVLTFCAEAGISLVEAMVHPQAPRHFRVNMTDDELGRVLEQAGRLGITFAALALSNDFTAAPEHMDDEIESVRAGLMLAKRLRIKRVRLFAGWRRAEGVDAATFARMVAALQAVTRQAAQDGVRLALENHGGITATAADVQRILLAVGHDAMGLLYDPANFVRSSEDPLRALRDLQSALVYTHAKDLTDHEQRGAVCAVGQGVMPWTTILDELAHDPGALVIIEQTNPADARVTTQQSLGTIRAHLKKTAEARA